MRNIASVSRTVETSVECLSDEDLEENEEM